MGEIGKGLELIDYGKFGAFIFGDGPCVKIFSASQRSGEIKAGIAAAG